MTTPPGENIIKVGGKQYVYYYNEATDGFADTLRMNVLRGRWFDRSDDGAGWTAAVINLRLAREMFGDEDPVGQLVEDETEPDPASPVQHERTRLRIVGVIDDFRKDGEYSAPGSFLIARNRLDDPRELIHSPRVLLVRVRPGTTAAFEEKLVSRLRAAAPDWTFQSEPLELKRDESHRNYIGPLAAAGVVAAFLLIMVALGLTGVLWLNVTQRTREIGLRRAEGRHHSQCPAAARGRGDRPDNPGRSRGCGGSGPVPAVRAVRRSAAGRVPRGPRACARRYLCADDRLRVRPQPARRQRAAGGGAAVRIGARDSALGASQSRGHETSRSDDSTVTSIPW